MSELLFPVEKRGEKYHGSRLTHPKHIKMSSTPSFVSLILVKIRNATNKNAVHTMVVLTATTMGARVGGLT